MNTGPWLAQRVRTPSPVPAGCLGLLHGNGTTQLYAPGEQAQARLEETLWWVSTTGALRLVFAPNAHSPEAGLSLYIGPVFRAGRLLFGQALGDWLATLACDTVTPEVLLAALRYRMAQPLRAAMLPCLQADELAQVRDEINRSIEHGMGLYCEELFRVDLGEAQQHALTASEPTLDEHIKSVATSDAEDIPLYLGEFQRNEVYAEARFFREVPLLCDEIERRRPVHDQAEATTVERARNVLLDLRALKKSRAGRRPQIPADKSPTQNSSPETLRFMALASRRATQGLDAAWGALAPADVVLEVSQIAALETAVQQMRQALDQRFTPWWRLAA